MKPMPRSSFQALTTPVTMVPTVGAGACAGATGTMDVPRPAPLASAGRAPVTFFAVRLLFMGSQLSSKITGKPTWRQTPSKSSHLCTNASSPPSSGWMKPMPRSSIQDLHVPETIWPIVCVGRPRVTATACMPLLAPFASAEAAPEQLLATRLPLDVSQPSSKTTGEPGMSHTPSTSWLLCTKRSSPPESGVMKPMPRSSTQAFTTPPTAMAEGTLAAAAAASRATPPAAPPIMHLAASLFPLEASQPSSKSTLMPTTRD
mmetsp:Transcript_93370/g.290600  ORF Transcript_93370/g.290600 Transcript_93370/m.290600 type:complete len:260 (-) Transcript_93370:391-1170(-)